MKPSQVLGPLTYTEVTDRLLLNFRGKKGDSGEQHPVRWASKPRLPGKGPGKETKPRASLRGRTLDLKHMWVNSSSMLSSSPHPDK